MVTHHPLTDRAPGRQTTHLGVRSSNLIGRATRCLRSAAAVHVVLCAWRPPRRLRLRAGQACCVAAGLPVIDSGMVAFEHVVRLAVSRPMPAVGEASNSPPYHALSDALAALANAYRAAGAEVFNVGGPDTAAMREE
jgi:hypothetical protein